MTAARFADSPRLLGERVELRRPVREDADFFLEAVRSSRRLHASWVQPPTTVAAYRRWLAEAEDGRRERWLVWHRDGRDLAGYLAANEIVLGAFQSAYLGYWAVQASAGRGLMKEALSLAIVHWFGRKRLRLHRLEANIQPENDASRALARSLGFRLEGLSRRYLKVAGRWRDHERWAITTEDWRSLRGSRR